MSGKVVSCRPTDGRRGDSGVKMYIRLILLALMLVTVVYIFSNSARSQEESTEQSDTVKEIVDEVIPDAVPAKPDIIENIRKLAHFTEFGLLGVEVALYVIIFERRRLALALPLSFALPFAVGFLDESIQVLSSRGPSITDVWIDVGGFASFAATVYALFGIAVGVVALYRHHSGKSSSESAEEQPMS